jgi:hypothetical protein
MSTEQRWAEKTAVEKREERFRTWLGAGGTRFESAAAEEAYAAAITRLRQAVEMDRSPDRIPILLFGTFMVANLYGVTPYEAMYDTEKLLEAHRKFLVDYKPDYSISPTTVGSGTVFDLLDQRQYKRPGHGVSKESVYQYVEGEYMGSDDYEALIEDPTDFWLRRLLPRVFGALEPLKNIPPFTELWEIVGNSLHMIAFAGPEIQAALKALMDAGNAAALWAERVMKFEMDSVAMGFPGIPGGVTKAPFDLLADTLRGTRAIMIDMYRKPAMVVKAVERLTPLAIKQGVRGATMSGNPIVFIPLHKGADGFMSDEQFKRFYWPGLKTLILGLVDEGCIPYLFAEGAFNSRLEYLKELPRGSGFWLFDRTDMAQAKAAIGDKICIAGNVPAGLILTGDAERMRAYCKNLIDVAGKGGGFIMAIGTSMDEAKPDTLHALVDFTKEYGVYR